MPRSNNGEGSSRLSGTRLDEELAIRRQSRSKGKAPAARVEDYEDETTEDCIHVATDVDDEVEELDREIPGRQRAHPRDAKYNEDIMRQAQKEVRFSLPDLDGLLPGENKRADTALRRRSSNFSTLPTPAQFDEETATVTIDNDENGLPIVSNLPTYREFKDKITRVLADWRYDEDLESLENDFSEKVAKMASDCARKAGSAFPYYALTDYGKNAGSSKGSASKYNGLVNFEQFKEMVTEDPLIMFLEVKARVLGMLALHDQRTQIHQICKVTDRNLAVLHGWADGLGQQIQSSGPLEDAVAGTEAVDRLTQELRDKDDEILELNQLIADMSKEKRQLEKRMAQGKNTTPEVMVHPRDRVSDRHDSPPPRPRHHREDTLLTLRTEGGHTERTEGGTKKSQKVDVPVYYHDKAKDTLGFEMWYRLITNKIEVNSDHFYDDKAIQTYLEGRIQGKAAEDLFPYLCDDHPDQIKSSKQLLRHLWNEYHDPNKLENAIDDFYDADFRMKPGDDYMEFRNKFVRLAGACHVPKKDWKQQFKRRLLNSIATALTRDYLDPTVSFEEYVRLGAEMAQSYKQQQRRWQVTEAKDKKTDKPSGRTGRRTNHQSTAGTGNATSQATATGTVRTGGRLTNEEAKQLALEGRCFSCKEKGHVSSTCPKRATDRAARDARIQAIADRVAPRSESVAPTSSSAPKTNPKSNKAKVEESEGDDSDSEN